jgi:hypothetical protein
MFSLKSWLSYLHTHKQPAAAAFSQAATNQKQNPPLKNLASFFRESFISSGKQGGGATVLREGA